ncbi:prophage tail fiber N-terminal domain-containing protein, partial [Escherichia coli]|nr:prophage tail fiber N-terminal domain-containing protein [Escherichia coli]
MAVKISGVLKDGTGKPVQNCTIQLKAKRNSTTVVVNTVGSENPDEAGRYSMDVEYGQYSVILQVDGFPPSHAGTITVYEDSQPGTLNDFLCAMTEDDARPEVLRRLELMVEEVARNASVVAQSTADAKKSAGDASASAAQVAALVTDATDSARAASTSAGQAASSAQEASSGAEAASAKATEAEKSAAAAESSKNAAATSAAAAKTSETNAAASQQSAATSASTAATKASEAATSARDAVASKEAAKSSETNASSSAGRAASSATAAENSARAANTSETNARSSETAAERSASAAADAKTAAAGSASTASTKATEAAGSAVSASQSKSAAEAAAIRAENSAKRAEDIASAVALEDADTTRKGIVQLSSATNSTSETLAATPKAVKVVMDETNRKAPLDSPALTGTPTAPTALRGTNNTQIANTAFVLAAIADVIDASPDALNTLNELAAALGNDPDFATTMTNALAGKQP